MIKIFVGNLSFDTTEDSLRTLFAEKGAVNDVSIVTDRATGRPRGFAFVTMTDSREARAAIDMLNGVELDGRKLNVSAAQSRASVSQPGHREFSAGGGSERERTPRYGRERQPRGDAGPGRWEPLRRSREKLRTLQIFVPDAEPARDATRVAALRDATINFLHHAGFELDPAKRPEATFGSWSLLAWFKRAASSDGAANLREVLEEALRLRGVDQVGSQTFATRAAATCRLLGELEGFKQAAIRLGDVLIVKWIVDGEPRLTVETISHQLQRELDADPSLLRDPARLFQRAHVSIRRDGPLPDRDEQPRPPALGP